MYKLIFIDIDDTLKPHPTGRNPVISLEEQELNFPNGSYPANAHCDGKAFDAISMNVLRELCKDPKARMVVSSYWRTFLSLAGFKELFAAWGFNPDIVIGCTPVSNGDLREQEIQAWLLSHPEYPPESILILDDQSYRFRTTWPNNWVQATHLLRDQETQDLAKKVLNTPVNYSQHPDYLAYLAAENATTNLNVFSFRTTTDFLKIFNICMALRIDREQLLLSTIEWVMNKNSVRSAFFDLYHLSTLKKCVHLFKQAKQDFKLQLYIDDEIPIEFVMHHLSKVNYPVRLMIRPSHESNLSGFISWCNYNQWLGQLDLHVPCATPKALLYPLSQCLALEKHKNVSLFTDFEDNPLQLTKKVNVLDSEKYLHLEGNMQKIYKDLGPSEQSLEVARVITQMHKVFSSFLKENLNTVTVTFASLHVYQQYIYGLFKEFFIDEHMGFVYRSGLKNIPGVIEILDLDETNKVVKKAFWRYASHYLVIQYGFDNDKFDAGFILNMNSVVLQLKMLHYKNLGPLSDDPKKLIEQTAACSPRFLNKSLSVRIEMDGHGCTGPGYDSEINAETFAKGLATLNF